MLFAILLDSEQAHMIRPILAGPPLDDDYQEIMDNLEAATILFATATQVDIMSEIEPAGCLSGS